MPTRSVILWLGDESIKGNRPASELSAIDPTYVNPQADSRIWNVVAGAWQQTQAGTNTDITASGFWGPEARAREGLRSRIPTGSVDHIKYAVAGSTLLFADYRRNPDGTAAGGSLKPCWHPSARDTSAYCAAIAEVKAAQAAAVGAGDTLRIDGIVLSIFAEEVFLLGGHHNYGRRMQELIDALRVDLVATAGVTLGSLRGSGATPVVLVLPHARFDPSLSEEQKGRILSMRVQLEALQSDAQRIACFAPLGLTTMPDFRHFDAQSLVAIGNELPSLFYAPATPSETDPEASLVLLVGDSIADGAGLTPHPDYLTGPQTGSRIWSRDRQQFETSQIGVNNMCSVSSSLGIMGLETPLGSLFRDEFHSGVWTVKAAMIGARAAPARERYVPALGPLYNTDETNWSPVAEGGMADLAMAWLRRACEALRKQARTPKVKAVVLSLGSNDLILGPMVGQVDGPSEVVPSLQLLLRRLKRHLQDLRALSADYKVVLLQPTSTINSPFTKQLRADLKAWVAADPEVEMVDLSPYPTNDGLHPSTPGILQLAQDIFKAWKSGTDQTVQPLFCRTKDDLKKALRLSQVPQSNDAVHQIDEAIRTARARAYRALGEARIAEILSTPHTDAPLSAAEYTRTMAASIEVKMVRVELMRSMPIMFMDGGSATQTWNEEAAFRHSPYLQTRDEIRRLEDDVRKGLQILQSNDTQSMMHVLFPDDYHNPGDTAFRGVEVF